MINDMDNLNESYALVAKFQISSTPEIYNIKYYPDDNEPSIWMYAMITVGSAFVLFVVITLYLMCHSAIRQVGEQDMVSRTTTSRGGTGHRQCQTA